MSTIIVIGGGPAGIMAAISAAKAGNYVILLEKNSKLGKKLSITGGGRCNITNSADINEFNEHIISNHKFLYTSFFTFFNSDIIALLESNGTKTKEESGGRIFPVSNNSQDVITALVQELKKYNVSIRTNIEVKTLLLQSILENSPESKSKYGYNAEAKSKTDFEFSSTNAEFNPESKFTKIYEQNKKISSSAKARQSKEQSFCLGVKTTGGEIIKGDIVIVTTGGISYPVTGSTGDGYKFAKLAGHKIVSPIPTLTPFIIKEKYIRTLQGISLKNIHIKIKNGKKTLFEKTGEILFTHYGISGPLILNASSYCNKFPAKNPLTLSMDFLPDEDDIDKYLLKIFAKNPNKQIANVLKKNLPEALSICLLKKSDIKPEKAINEISKKERRILGENIKNLTLTISSAKKKEAIITQGGINIKEIHPSTMASKKISGLKFAGEVLDLDAETGGYNLQIAWSTGYTAGITCS